jgi:hypothetical protein
MYAARFTNNISRDLREMTSSAGWGLPLCSSREKAERVLRELARERVEARLADRLDEISDQRIEALVEDEVEALDLVVAEAPEGGFYVARRGLSAFVGETVREAVEAALADDRFEGLPLYVFAIEHAELDDEDSGVWSTRIARVWPVPGANPHRVR